MALRRISENMEQLQSNGLAVFTGSAFSGPKVELAARFGHLVSRHLGLCQLVSYDFDFEILKKLLISSARLGSSYDEYCIGSSYYEKFG